MTDNTKLKIEKTYEDPDEYTTTTDLYMAATLMTAGNDLVDFHSNRRKVKFIFENTDKLQEAAKKYLNSDLKLSPSKLFDNLQRLKSIIHS